MHYIVRNIEELPLAAKSILSEVKGTRVVCFHGEMGAGKTTLIRALCAELGVVDEVSSPTFSIVQEYRRKSGEPVYHFDFYRLKNEAEALAIGVEDYLFSGHFCLIEWPEKAGDLLNLQKADIFITVEDGVRTIRTNYG